MHNFGLNSIKSKYSNNLLSCLKNRHDLELPELR